MGQAAAEPGLRRSGLVILNGAAVGQSAALWDDRDDSNYDRIRDTTLKPRGLSERQVQVVWVKVANANPTRSLPGARSDAVILLTQLGDIVRTLKVRYPNLRQVFLSSRTYGGYSRSFLNPEPYAYESGFAVKWLIRAQIDQMARGGDVRDGRAGNLDSRTTAPWIAWGPYLWANGSIPRSDALTWTRADFEMDGVHPSRSGERKVGALLLAFFIGSPYTRCWFVAGETC